MSRAKRYAHALASNYLFLGVSALYTLASVPLALQYLSKAQFGLWALTVQMAAYIWWIDLGMWSSVSRILIDHKDQRADGRYSAAIRSGLLVGAVQGSIALVIGLGLVWFLGDWLRVPAEQSSAFLWLMIGQVLIAAATFVTRIFFQILCACQRMDLTNYFQIAALVLSFGALWAGFWLGWGIFSMLLSTALTWVCNSAFCAAACFRLGVWPGAGEWGRASRALFRELFSFGADVFLIGAGMQLILSSQTILVSRQLGMEAAALWSVMTKAFSMVANMIIWRGIGNAMPALAEMQVRKEHERLWSRFRSLFLVFSVFAAVCGILFAACNGPFVRLWTHGRFSWPAVDNVLLAAWLVALTQQTCFSSLVISLKEIRGLKYIFLLEGAVFVGVALVVLRHAGMTGMLICSVLATFVFTWFAGAWRLVNLSRIGWKALLWDWQWPLLRVLLVMAPCGLLLAWVLRDMPDWVRLAVNAPVLAIIGAWAGTRLGLPPALVAEISGRLPPPLRRIVCLFAGVS